MNIEDLDEQDNCGICLVEFENGEKLKMLDCAKDEERAYVRHIFH